MLYIKGKGCIFHKKLKVLLKTHGGEASLKKDCGKVLTMEGVGDIITKLSTKAAADRTLKIEQHSRRTRRIKPLYSFE